LKIVLLLQLILLFSMPIVAQETEKPSTFHRLLIFNNQNELLVVRVKNSNRWVTPGWYQDNSLTIKDGLDALARSYGIAVTVPTLRGVFTLRSDQNQQISTRLVYSTKFAGGKIKMPDIIDEIRWLSVSKAMEIMTFPHINAQLDQLTKFPDSIWGGSQLMYQEDGVYKVKIIEGFYPLASVLK